MFNKKPTGIEQLQRMKQKPIKKMDRILRGVCIYWVAFVCVAWITFWVKDAVPDTLIQYGLGGGAVELIVTGFIEIVRDIRSRKEDEK